MAKSRLFDRQRMARRVERILDKSSSMKVFFSNPEDTILAKLEWNKLGGQASEVQWRDVISIFQQQGERLDINYLRVSAEAMELSELLEQSIAASGQ